MKYFNDTDIKGGATKIIFFLILWSNHNYLAGYEILALLREYLDDQELQAQSWTLKASNAQ